MTQAAETVGFQVPKVDGSRFMNLTNKELRSRLAEEGCFPPRAFGKAALANLLSDCIDNREHNARWGAGMRQIDGYTDRDENGYSPQEHKDYWERHSLNRPEHNDGDV